ncbi:MAG: hypothetical protein ACXADY_12895 [Candidatus Hodarchaeales archaeon]
MFRIIIIPKNVFNQGETIQVRIDLSNNNFSVTEGTLSLIGMEKVEFSVQSLFGKKGFHPGWSYFLPSRHLRESQEFLTQSHELSAILEGAKEEQIEIDVPENAIPSYYGDNGKVVYTIELDLEIEGHYRKKVIQQILIDSDYIQSHKTEINKINSGKIIINYPNPFVINTRNTFEVSTEGLHSIDTLRFILIGREIVTASSVTINNQVCELPLGQIQFDSDLVKIPITFSIPSKFQHNYEGLFSRMEYSIEISQVSETKRFGISRKSFTKLSELLVNVEYQKRQNDL